MIPSFTVGVELEDELLDESEELESEELPEQADSASEAHTAALPPKNVLLEMLGVFMNTSFLSISLKTT